MRKLPICITVEPCLTQFIQRLSFVRKREKESGDICLAMSPGESDRQKHSPLLLSHLASGQKTLRGTKMCGKQFRMTDRIIAVSDSQMLTTPVLICNRSLEVTSCPGSSIVTIWC